MSRDISSGSGRPRDRRWFLVSPGEKFLVIPRENENGEGVYVVVGPMGEALYSFIDLREANAEAAELNMASAGTR